MLFNLREDPSVIRPLTLAMLVAERELQPVLTRTGAARRRLTLGKQVEGALVRFRSEPIEPPRSVVGRDRCARGEKRDQRERRNEFHAERPAFDRELPPLRFEREPRATSPFAFDGKTHVHRSGITGRFHV